MRGAGGRGGEEGRERGWEEGGGEKVREEETEKVRQGREDGTQGRVGKRGGEELTARLSMSIFAGMCVFEL